MGKQCLGLGETKGMLILKKKKRAFLIEKRGRWLGIHRKSLAINHVSIIIEEIV